MPVHSTCPDPECQAAAARKSNGEERQQWEQPTCLSGQSSGRTSPTLVFNPYYTGRPRTPVTATKHVSIDRQEIIRKIKSREDRSRPTSPELERPASSGGSKKVTSLDTPQSTDIGGIFIGNIRPRSRGEETDTQAVGMQIERPRSALHRGDFRQKEDDTSSFEAFAGKAFAGAAPQEQAPSLSTSPVAPWHSEFPVTALRQPWFELRQRQTQLHSTAPPRGPLRSRAVSSVSTAPVFVYQPPTSPLVIQSRPDTPPPHPRRSSRSPDKQTRRHTFSPQALQRFSSDLEYPHPARVAQGPPKPMLRKEGTYPYQAHQPRRSVHVTNVHGASPTSPPRSAFSSRRPSISSDAHSPLHHAPMVGSYEESILRGRMSTTPSKPLNFIAQIGVLGKGNCKAKMKCPPHVTVPFPAVFYSYGSGIRSGSAGGDKPSPYVGLVDLEHSLANPEIAPDKRRQRLEDRLHVALSDEGSRASSRTRDECSSGTEAVQTRRIRRKQKKKRRSGSPKAPPGGCYRIPQQGQIQIVIKNPNKNAVKLFLVPYDLSDMEPGQKTFIRQRSYSAGPIIDMPLSSRKNLGTDRPEASLSNSEDPNERPVLRYLVHLHICCTGRGRYWLYKSIRVVFANRVPDGKEKLRNEIQLPEPRYSAYKPGRDPTPGASLSNTPSEFDRRRKSDAEQLIPFSSTRRFLAQSLPTNDFNNGQEHSSMLPFRFPFQPAFLSTLESRPASRQASDAMDLDSERTHSDTGGPLSPISSNGTGEGMGNGYSTPLSPSRRLEEAFTFEREPSRDRSAGRIRGNGESLLSQRLMSLGMRENLD